MNASSVLVFDMDGVLADVRDSYLSAIALTVGHFVGTPAPMATIDRISKPVAGITTGSLLTSLFVKLAMKFLMTRLSSFFRKSFWAIILTD